MHIDINKASKNIPGISFKIYIYQKYTNPTECSYKVTYHTSSLCVPKITFFLLLIVQKTHAYHRMKDDVPEEIKKARLKEIIDTFYSIAGTRNQRFIGSEQLVLVEKVSCMYLHT